jgi:transposase
MRWIGCDVHKDYLFCVHLDADGGVLAEETVTAEYSAVKTWVETLDPGTTTIALESCYAWEYVYDLADARGIRVLVADPALLQPAVKQRANKNDRDDAKNLANLARLDLLPLVHPVERRYRELRALTRHRIFLTQTKTAIKNHVTFLLDRAGVRIGVTDIFGKKGRKAIDQVVLPFESQLALSSSLKQLDAMATEVDALDRELARRVPDFPEVKLLMTIPGVGYWMGLVIAAEAAGMSRFANAKKFQSYTGLVPSRHQSGRTDTSGSITRRGSAELRWALVVVTQNLKAQPGPIRDFFLRLEPKKGANRAKVACASKLAEFIWCMLTRGQTYRARQPVKEIAKVDRMQRRAKAYDLNAERIERQYERHFGTEGAPGV